MVALKLKLDVLDAAVEKTIRPFLVEQDQLNDTDGEGYHHTKILPTVQPHLTEDSLTADAKSHLEAAVKGHVNLLSQFELMPALKFIRESDGSVLAEHVQDLLYGSRPIQERMEEFLSWSTIQPTEAGDNSGINALTISYLLAVAFPDKFAFCKPNVYTAAANALLEGGALKPRGIQGRVDRLAHANEFYREALQVFRKRYKLPFDDLFHVHAAFYVMSNPRDGFPGWEDILSHPIEPSPKLSAMHSLNVILYGPPGTGKTYDTTRRAVEICDGEVPSSQEALVERYRKLRSENRIGFVTFHQSYGYEDFVEGIRPALKQSDTSAQEEGASDIQFECRPGIFRRTCSLAKSNTARRSAGGAIDWDKTTVWKMSLGDTQIAEDADVYDECIKNNCVLMGYGWGVDYEDCDDKEAIREKLETEAPDADRIEYQVQLVDMLKHRMAVGDLVVISDGNHKFRAVGRVTGEYQFTDRESYNQMRPVEWLLTLEESLPHDVINSKIFSQKTLYCLQKSNLNLEALQELIGGVSEGSHNYVLIIDEVNRGNISKILGELITLLEPDKRLGAENELQVTLPYSGDSFGVPQNVYVIGTMNTADRSIAFLDVALRRRFEFVEMMPDARIIRDHVGDDGLVDDVDIPQLFETINERIELLYDRDHQIGHSFFLGVESLPDLRDVFCQKVIPLLQEYFYGDWAKVCLVLGCPLDATGKNKNSHPIIKTHVLKTSKLIGGGDDFIEDKRRCFVDPVFVSEASGSALLPYFEGIVGSPGEV